MSSTKLYLKVPYTEKDAAKTLGAKWDANQKKWYVPEKLDISLFSKWFDESNQNSSQLTNVKPDSSNKTGIFTQPSIKNFVAYDGDEPPWN
ncbi:DUF5710 domain-containing protein [Methylomonas sp. AM2-LC]|uniref:DUF5710 domain-containing protein n=1 Tax=Methylomonas sp. AM2-LC TaxID=3153301 RepID=UPI003264E8F3